MDDKKKKEEKVEVKMIEYFFAISMQNSKPISQILVINSQSDITASVNWNYIVCWQTLVDQSGNLLNEVGIWWRVVYHKQRVEAGKGKSRGRRHPLFAAITTTFVWCRERECKSRKLNGSYSSYVVECTRSHEHDMRYPEKSVTIGLSHIWPNPHIYLTQLCH